MAETNEVREAEPSPAEALLDAAENLAEALVRVRALTARYTALTIDIVNDALERAGVRIVEGGRS
jgi:hypothetical protein